MSRREASRRRLQLWALLLAAMATASSEQTTGTLTGRSSPKIVVVGAGPAGIACATKLLQYGFEDVVVVEAEPRIGGRINTIPFADNVVDLGAQWCHGEKGNVVYELAHEHDLLESSGDRIADCVRSNREVVSESLSQRLNDMARVGQADRHRELRHFNGSLGSYLTNKFQEALRRPENSDIDRTIASEFFENFKKIECSGEASDNPDEVSGRGIVEFWESEGDYMLNWKGKGYQEFLRLLMRSRETGTDLGVLERRVLLSKAVEQIRWNRSDSSVEIQYEDGEVSVVDHVIVTVSLGVLKEQHARLFQPQLPLANRRAIDGLGFGTVNKILMEFSEQFWPQNWTGFSLFWRNDDIDEIRGGPRAWLEGIYGFYTEDYQPRILSGWLTGHNARHMETLSEDEVRAGSMYLLRKFLDWEIPEPVNFKTSAWSTNPHFRGSYSFHSLTTDEVGTGPGELAQPLIATKDGDKPIVQFAGEATSDHHHSTVHGAVESGWREAKRLAVLYGRQLLPSDAKSKTES